MLMLISGLLLWSIIHLFPSLAPEKRQAVIDKRGEKAYKAAFAICILAGLALIVFGWRSMTMIAAYREFLYVAPIGVMHFAKLVVLIAFIIFGASNYPSRIRQYIRHPQLTGVFIWACAHLVMNGDVRSVVLFGGMALWSLLSIILINRRDGEYVKPEVPGWGREIRGLVISIIIFGVVTAIHPYIAGMPVA